ncbi:MAG TPA: hypothetical protein VMT73_11095 [Anaerolineales bacterium]|nr:hypothetical protein [Anaerolineales bacterium]
MPDILTFQCPNCGSSVHTDGTKKEAKCEYCGSTVIVPESLRNQPAPAPVEVNFGGFQSGGSQSGGFQPGDFTPFSNDQVAKSIGTAAKVTAGVTALSVILPVVFTCVILGFVGVVLYFVFSGVNKSIPAIAAIPTDSFPTVAPTAVPDTAVPPTAIPTPFDTPTPYTKVLLKDNFTNTSSGWDKTKNSDYTLEYLKGKYHVLINKENGGQVLWIGDSYTDMSIEVDALQTAGPNDGDMGVACRPNDSGGFYSFEFTQDGHYGIYKYTDWNPEPLAEGVLDPNTISTTTPTHIEGVCDGSTLSLILNGQALLQVQDSDYTKGGLGLIVTTGNTGQPGVDVLFSTFLAKGPK